MQLLCKGKNLSISQTHLIILLFEFAGVSLHFGSKGITYEPFIKKYFFSLVDNINYFGSSIVFTSQLLTTGFQRRIW